MLRSRIASGYDYWLGGKDNFAADRAFLASAVRFLTVDMGIRHSPTSAPGSPTASNTHQLAQRAASNSRVLYVDDDRCTSGCAHARRALPRSGSASSVPRQVNAPVSIAAFPRQAGGRRPCREHRRFIMN
jgi:S-adenosyl methyltransferase